MKGRFWWVGILAALLVVMATVIPTHAAVFSYYAPMNNTGKFVDSDGVFRGSGEARYRYDDSTGYRELRVDLYNLPRRLISNKVNLYVGTIFIGSINVNGQGNGSLSINSSRRWVPDVQSGWRAEVETTGGTDVLEGEFR